MNDKDLITFERILDLIHKDSPYIDFPIQNYALSIEGWHSNSQVFEEVILELKPKFVLEVGTWLGASAINMASILKKNKIESIVMCIDTWLGAEEFWSTKDDSKRYDSLQLVNGYPNVYYQFIANVIHSDLSNVIVPFPQTSLIGARWLKKNAMEPDLIYIDGSHHEDDVYADLSACWEILGEEGMLFGDDYDAYWPGVILAVNRFASELNLQAAHNKGFWFIRKNGRSIQLPDNRNYDELTALRAENSVLRSRLEARTAIAEDLAHLVVENQRENARAGYFCEQLEIANGKINELKQKIESFENQS